MAAPGPTVALLSALLRAEGGPAFFRLARWRPKQLGLGMRKLAWPPAEVPRKGFARHFLSCCLNISGPDRTWLFASSRHCSSARCFVKQQCLCGLFFTCFFAPCVVTCETPLNWERPFFPSQIGLNTTKNRHAHTAQTRHKSAIRRSEINPRGKSGHYPHVSMTTLFYLELFITEATTSRSGWRFSRTAVLEAKRPPRDCFRSKTVKKITAGV